MDSEKTPSSKHSTHRHEKPPSRQAPGKLVRKRPGSRPSTDDVPQTPQDDMKIKNPDIAFIFNPSRDQVKEYHLDGDSTMYTEQALAMRQALKIDPQIVASINDFITLYKADAGGRVSRREYEGVQTKLCRILRPGMDPYEMKRVIDEDWKRDTSGADSLSRELLFDSLFELCDVWCPNIDVEEYKAFFDQLKFRLRYDGMRDQAAYDILRDKDAYYKELLCEERRAELLKKYIARRRQVRTAKPETVEVKQEALPQQLAITTVTGEDILPTISPSKSVQETQTEDDSILLTPVAASLRVESSAPQEEAVVFEEFAPEELEPVPQATEEEAVTGENVDSSENSSPRASATPEFKVPMQIFAEGDEDAAFVFLRSHYLRNPAPRLSDEELELNFQGRLTIEKEIEIRKSFKQDEEP